MFYLILAIITSSLVSIMMRVGESHVKENNISLLSVNYFVCFLLSIVYMGTGAVSTAGEGLKIAVGLGFLNGFFYIGSFVAFQYSVKRNGVVLSSIFMKLGILIPMILSIVAFKETPTVRQVVGFAIALVAIILINFEKNSANVTFKLGLLLVLIGCGCADGMSKVYEELGTPKYEEQFLVLTFLLACLISLIIVIVKKQRFGKNELLYGVLLGVPNYYSARFLLKALGQVPAVVAYPTFSVATIALVSMTGVIAFKERFSKKQILAIIIITVSIVLLN